MDRIISDEERIRRAEDVLERRKNTDLRISSDSFIKEKNNNKIKNMLMQILICLLLYCGIYYIKNTQNENYKGFINYIYSILNHDVDFKKIYDELYKNIKKININKLIKSNNNDENAVVNEIQNENNEVESKTNENIITQENEDKQSEQNIDMGIGGGAEELISQINNVNVEEDQMKIDSEYIKSKYNIINPLKGGVVTSKFGERASTEIVSANHRGIDLGANTGTVIVGAIDGTVIEASSTGDFGLHLKIADGDITVIYAHCSEILVKEGDKIKQGEQIAKVGSTGKATGPHLHFEIRRENRAVNPEYLLQF